MSDNKASEVCRQIRSELQRQGVQPETAERLTDSVRLVLLRMTSELVRVAAEADGQRAGNRANLKEIERLRAELLESERLIHDLRRAIDASKRKAHNAQTTTNNKKDQR